jgi:hypothetical protein
MFVTAVPNRSIGDVIKVGRGKQLRVIAIDDFPHAVLVEQDVRAIFTVELVTVPNQCLNVPAMIGPATRALSLVWFSKPYPATSVHPPPPGLQHARH